MGKEGSVGCSCTTEKRPRFFKVFFPRLNSKQLEISPAFWKQTRRMRRVSTCFLTGPSSNVWRVDMIKNESGVFFRDGWEAFVQDHSLQTGEFLVFEYEGRSRFSVMIFDASMCEKEGAFDVCSSQALGAAGRREPRVKVKEEPSSTRKGETTGSGRLPSRKEGTSPNAKRKPGKKNYMGVWESQRRPVTKEEIKKAHQEAFSFKSANPLLVQIMRRQDVLYGHMMRLPPSFARQHFPTNRRMTFWDPIGQPWTVNYVSCSGRYFFSGGWRKFALANFLEEDDACVFELVKENEIRVHVFRVVEEIEPLIRKVGL